MLDKDGDNTGDAGDRYRGCRRFGTTAAVRARTPGLIRISSDSTGAARVCRPRRPLCTRSRSAQRRPTDCACCAHQAEPIGRAACVSPGRGEDPGQRRGAGLVAEAELSLLGR